MRERWPRLLAAGVIASSLFVPGLLTAQATLAQAEDASAPPRGLLRLRVLTAWSRFDSRFTTDGTERLGAEFTSDALGSGRIPELGSIESLVQASSGSPFTLSLGRSTLNAVAREVIIPFALDYGITNRLSVGVVVPVVQKRATLLHVLDSTGSNVGPNPARTGSAAANRVAQVQAEFANAASSLQARLQSCQTNPGDPGCANIVGREAEAQALIQASQAFAGQLATLFGSLTLAGQAFVPRAGSTAQTAIATRIATFNAEYQAFLATSANLIVAVPMGAGGGAGPEQFQQFLTEELGRDSLTTQEHIGIGDVEIGAKFLVVDAPPTARRRSGMTFAVASSVRLPTGSRQTVGEMLDLRLGEGAVVIDSRAVFDGRFGRVGLLASGQLAIKASDDDAMSGATSAPASELFPSSTRMVQLHLAPRWHISDPLSFHGAYSVRSTDKSGGDQLIGGGVSFSTLRAFRTGESRAIPMEMRFTHLEAIAGDPGRPKFFRDQIELRIYYRLRR